ncbi:hypothetical protein FACS189451_08430 [Bacteroidia bacterium]|nr:hypothetical protein FACS189446_6810 [Bacteroidia bacterium]GHT62908.1 hypothetical protein FACS189451_08430 [Bacteroidia bacterium]
MREKMKKMLFLMLFLIILGAASVSAQVRIGGNGEPNASAVLDLNANDATNNGKAGLALPRVALDSTKTVPAGMATPVNGLTVYNTATAKDVTPGTYYWENGSWNRLAPATSAGYKIDYLTQRSDTTMGVFSSHRAFRDLFRVPLEDVSFYRADCAYVVEAYGDDCCWYPSGDNLLIAHTNGTILSLWHSDGNPFSYDVGSFAWLVKRVCPQ